MTTLKQIAANRINSQDSTGPKTQNGKNRSAKNAITHGLTMQSDALILGEDPEDFRIFHLSISQEFNPTTAFEMHYVQRIAHLAWKVQRIPKYEVLLLDYLEAREEAYFEYEHKTGQAGFGSPDDPWDGFTMYDKKRPEDQERRLKFGSSLRTLLDTDLLSKLDRHEATLVRRLNDAIRDLRNYQENRKKMPITLDLDIEAVEEQATTTGPENISEPEKQRNDAD